MPRLRPLKNQTDNKGSCALIVLAVVVVTALIAKLIGLFLPPSIVPLFVEAPGLVQTASVEQASERLGRPLLLPKERFGSDLFLIGVYTEPALLLPTGSVAVILARDDWRFLEIIEKPGVTLEVERTHYAVSRTEEVTLGANKGILLTLMRGNVRCVEKNDHQVLGVCQLTKTLLFETDGMTVSISADGTHATDGELIAVAKSMLGL